MRIPPMEFRRFFDRTSHRSTLELRAVLGFLTDEDPAYTREELKAKGAHYLSPYLFKKYAAYVDFVTINHAFPVKRWVIEYLLKMRQIGRVDITLSDVISEKTMRQMEDESFVEYWAYAESLTFKK